MSSKIIYNKGDKVGTCIFIEETNPHIYIKYTGKHIKNRQAIFKCSCGKTFVSLISSVKSGNTKSCGCLNLYMLQNKKINLIHGLRHHPLYITWKAMLYRCEHPKYKHYNNYGGRGIAVCERWHDVSKFIEDMYPSYENGLEIDRIDNNGNYCPENCRWITHRENNKNKRSNRLIEYNGEMLCLRDWADKLSINYSTLQRRVNTMSTKEALTGSFIKRNRK